MSADCIREYIIHKVDEGFMGLCPTILCPCEHADKKMRLLDFATWSNSNIVPSETTTKFKLYAGSILAFLCGGCHALKSLQIEPCAKDYECAVNYLTGYFKQPSDSLSIERLLDCLRQYSLGELTVNEAFVETTEKYFTSLQHLTDRESFDIFKQILTLIADPERRANLHLRYLRWRPRIWTPCCQREHCFKCRTKDFHLGQACEDHVLALDNSILDCPSCGVYLVKGDEYFFKKVMLCLIILIMYLGDGCNTITCVCGKQFSWASEKEIMERALAFYRNHPLQTVQYCVAALVGENNSDINDAKAWQTRHRYEVSQGFLNYWQSKYKFCPHQAAALKLQESVLNDGVREAVSIWYSKFSAEVDECKARNIEALRSIFLTMYPNEATRTKDALSYLKRLPDALSTDDAFVALDDGSRRISLFDSKLIASMRLWLKEHPVEQALALQELERTASQQFLFLYGANYPSLCALFRSHTPLVGNWCLESSNPSLTFTNNNMSVQRVGNVSSYPAAIANLPANCDRSQIKVHIDNAPRGPNWLTVGIARKGMIPIASSDGLGRSLNTW